MGTDIYDIISEFATVITAVIPVIVGIAVLFFLWGLVTYILKTENQEARSAARNRMFWGVVIIFVMVSLWGFVNLLDSTLGLDNDIPDVPGIPGSGADCGGIICFDFDIDFGF